MDSAVAVAQTFASHAALSFVGALAGSWFLVLAIRVALARAGGGAGLGALPPRRALVVRVLLCAALLVGAALAFTSLAEALDRRTAISHFDIALAEALHLHLSLTTLQAFASVTRLGDVATLTGLCIVVAGLLVWRGQHTLAFFWVLAVAGNGVLNGFLKRTFERGRPVHDHAVFVADHGFSFPSGHSSGALVTYGMLAYVILRLAPVRWQLPVLMAATAIAVTTGLSRIVLQVHYASDVLAGFASGLCWLSLCVMCVEWQRLRPTAPPKH